MLLNSRSATHIPFYVNEILRVLASTTYLPQGQGPHRPSHQLRLISQPELRPSGGALGGECYSFVLPEAPEHALTHIDVANGHCPFQLQFYFQLPTLVLRATEPRSPLCVWVQQVLHRILGILSQREESIMNLPEPRGTKDAHE